MPHLFETADEAMKRFGFQKVKEDRCYHVRYEGGNNASYVQVIDLCHKADGNHLIQSYEKDVDYPGGFCRMAGIQHGVEKACLKKMREIGWR